MLNRYPTLEFFKRIHIRPCLADVGRLQTVNLTVNQQFRVVTGAEVNGLLHCPRSESILVM